MITVNLQGGLGNQLFQYACAYSVARKNGEELQLDLSSYSDYDKGLADYRPFKLDMYNIDFTKSFCLTPYHNKLDGFTKRVIKRWKLGLRAQCIHKTREEDVSVYYKDIFPETGDIYIVGWWANYNYFKDYKEDIIRQYTLKETGLRVKQAAIQLNKEPSVALHVRGGDYRKVGWCIDPCYYQKALETIRKKYNQCKIYIFTNDIVYAKDILKTDKNMVYASELWPQLQDYEELYLMSCCKSQIIVNSSFSWWAAFLNSNTEKIVISPKIKGMWKDFNLPEWKQIPTEILRRE